MKKLVAVLFSALLLLSVSACSSNGKPNTDSKDTVLTFWAHQNGPWNESYQQVIDKFEAANAGIKVKLEVFPYDDFESKVQTSLIDGVGGADIYELWGGWAIDFASTGALEKMPDSLVSHIREDVYAPTIGALEYDGNLYGLPLELNVEMGSMLVNLNVLNEAGLKAPTTWDELIKTAKTGTKKSGNTFDIKGFDFVNWDSVPYMFLSMILQQGGEYLSADGTINVNTPEAKKAFEVLADLVIKEGVTDLEGLTGGGDLEGYQALFAGRALFVPRGPWVISEGVNDFELSFGKDFDYIEMPWYGTEKRFAAETGWSLAINSHTKAKEAAYKFIEFFYQDEILLQHNINASQIPPKKSVANDPKFIKELPYMDVVIANLDGAEFVGYFNTDRMKETVNDVFTKYGLGEYKSIDDAISDMNQRLQTIAQ